MPYEISTKECSVCHEIKPLSKFKVGKNIAAVCNSCNKKRYTKVCEKCGKEKYVKQFYRNHNIWGICTACSEEAQKTIKEGYDLGFKVLDKTWQSISSGNCDGIPYV